MSDPVERRSKQRRKADRRDGDRRKSATLPAVVSSDAADAAFAAQLLGQGGEKRGLKGGQPVLEKARRAYLDAEWTGPKDRRLRAGKLAKTEV
jgi:hypothetical protein